MHLHDNVTHPNRSQYSFIDRTWRPLSSICPLLIVYDTGDSIIVEQYHLKRLIDWILPKANHPFLPLDVWTMVRGLISPLGCYSYCLISNAFLPAWRQSHNWSCLLIDGKVARAFIWPSLCCVGRGSVVGPFLPPSPRGERDTTPRTPFVPF